MMSSVMPGCHPDMWLCVVVDEPSGDQRHCNVSEAFVLPLAPLFLLLRLSEVKSLDPGGYGHHLWQKLQQRWQPAGPRMD